MKIVDIANEIFIDSFEPSYTSVPAIAFWIRGKIGTLNSAICEDYQIDDNGEVFNDNGPISMDAVAIIKQYYRVYNLEYQYNNQLNALANNTGLIEVQDNFGGATFRRVNKNEIAKNIASVRKDEIEVLNNLVSLYKINKGRPTQVAGDDTQSGQWGERLITVRNV